MSPLLGPETGHKDSSEVYNSSEINVCSEVYYSSERKRRKRLFCRLEEEERGVIAC